YAARLEHHARQAPYNWFNFYDFWHVDEQEQPPSGNAQRHIQPEAAAGGLPVPVGDHAAGVGAGRPRKGADPARAGAPGPGPPALRRGPGTAEAESAAAPDGPIPAPGRRRPAAGGRE